jgi:hypothetical protein
MGFFSAKKPAPRASLGAKPPASVFERDCAMAISGLQALTTAHVGTWHMDEADWTADQEKGEITFTNKRRGTVATAPVQIIGTFNTTDGTWMWGWANPSVAAHVVEDARKLKEYGTTHGVSELTSAKVKCIEQRAWVFAALACRLCARQGAYRGPAGKTMVFMTFGEVKISKLR